MSVHKIQSKYQNTTFLLVHIQIWIDFETTKHVTFKLNSSLFILTQKYTTIHMYVEYGYYIGHLVFGRQLFGHQMWNTRLWRLWKCWTFTLFWDLRKSLVWQKDHGNLGQLFLTTSTPSRLMASLERYASRWEKIQYCTAYLKVI